MIHSSLGPTRINSWVLYASCQNIGRHLVHLFLDFAKCGNMFAKHPVSEDQKMTWRPHHTCSLQRLCVLQTFMGMAYSKSLQGKLMWVFPTLLICQHCNHTRSTSVILLPTPTHSIVITMDIQKRCQLHLSDYGREYSNKSAL